VALEKKPAPLHLALSSLSPSTTLTHHLIVSQPTGDAADAMRSSAVARHTVLAAQAAWLLDVRRHWVAFTAPGCLEKLRVQLAELVDDGRPPPPSPPSDALPPAQPPRTSPAGALGALWYALGKPVEVAGLPGGAGGADAVTVERDAVEAAARVAVLGHALLRRCGGRRDGWYVRPLANDPHWLYVT
jgi:hypothetical protein